MLTNGQLTNLLGSLKVGVTFTAVFEDGDTMPRCLETDPTLTDAQIVEAFNQSLRAKGFDKIWGKVVAIKDRMRAGYWG